MKRQLDDYFDKFYNAQAVRYHKLSADDNKLAREIALWKETVAERWDAIKVVERESDFDGGVETGKKYKVRIVLDEAGLDDAVGLEFVVLGKNAKGEDCVAEIVPFKMMGRKDNLHTFEMIYDPDHAGTFKSGIRMFPKNELLPHRQDFAYVKWF